MIRRVGIIGALCGGIIAGEMYTIPLFFLYCFALAGIGIALLGRSSLWIRTGALMVLFFCIGVARVDFAKADLLADPFIAARDSEGSFEGTIISEIDRGSSAQRFVIRADGGVYDGRVVTAKTFSYPRYYYGDALRVRCTLAKPFADESFSYENYLKRFGVTTVCQRPDIERIASGRGNGVLSVLYGFKDTIQMHLRTVVGEPHASLLAGIIIGVRSSISEELQEAFSRAGLTHIVAISGFNIAIIIGSMGMLARFLPLGRRGRFFVLLGGIIVFILFTGFSSASVRAALMGSCALLATTVGRRSGALNGLLLASAMMIVVSPYILLYDAGFHLSFLATLGMIYGPDLVGRFFLWIPKRGGIRELTVQNFSALLFTTLYTAYNFGKISFIAPLANILVVPFIPIVMAYGAFVMLAALLLVPLGGWAVSVVQAIAWPLVVVLMFMEGAARWCASFPWAAMTVDMKGWGVWAVLLGHGILVLFVRFGIVQKTAMKKSIISSIVAMALFAGLSLGAPVFAAASSRLPSSASYVGKGVLVVTEDEQFALRVPEKGLKKNAVSVAVMRVFSQADGITNLPPQKTHTLASDVYRYDITGISSADIAKPFFVSFGTKPSFDRTASIAFFDTTQKIWKTVPTSRSGTVLRAQIPFPGVQLAVLIRKPWIAKDGSIDLDAMPVRAALVVDGDGGAVLLSKNDTSVVPLASLTKLMTALVFLDKKIDMKKSITISSKDLAPPANVPLRVGDQVRICDLWNAMLVGSKNDAAKALVRSTGMTEEVFVKAMNEKAQALGMVSTTFVDTTGLKAGNAAPLVDYERLAREAFSRDAIRIATKQKEYRFAEKKTGRAIVITNTDYLVRTLPMLDAGKTGYINESGYNLAVSAHHKDREVLAFVIGAPDSQTRFEVMNELVRRSLSQDRLIFASLSGGT